MKFTILNKDDFNKVSSILNKLDFKMALVHSDIFCGFKFNSGLTRQQILEAHWQSLKALIDNRPVWMPAFNYDYPKTKAFNVFESKSQVGVLPEFFRTKIASWRSAVPIFSFSGETEQPTISRERQIDPFDHLSLFDFLTNNNGLIIYYGTDISCSTIIHYCERISNKLLYRYDKCFEGIVNDEHNKEYKVALNYHVRPRNHVLQYDWELFEKDLTKNGLLFSLDDERFHLKIIKASHLVDYWISKLKDDNLSLLNADTKSWVSAKLEKLGRAFQLSDFE
jgi:aminoglycoside 3-N-acetyltransferase